MFLISFAPQSSAMSALIMFFCCLWLAVSFAVVLEVADKCMKSDRKFVNPLDSF